MDLQKPPDTYFTQYNSTASPYQVDFETKYYPIPHIAREESWMLKEHLVPDNKAKYRAAAVTAIDAGVGKIVQALKEQGLYENSILVFSTDNGGSRSPLSPVF